MINKKHQQAVARPGFGLQLTATSMIAQAVTHCDREAAITRTFIYVN